MEPFYKWVVYPVCIGAGLLGVLIALWLFWPVGLFLGAGWLFMCEGLHSHLTKKGVERREYLALIRAGLDANRAAKENAS